MQGAGHVTADRGRDRSDEAASQGMPRIASHHQKLGRLKEGFSQNLRGNVALLIP